MQITIDTPRAAIRVLLAHGNPLFHAGLFATIASQSRFEVSAVADAQSAREAIERQAADVVVTDYETAIWLAGHGHDGLGGRAASARPVARLMIVTWRRGADEIRGALSLGVQGYVLMWCAVQELLDGIEAVHQGRRHLGSQVARRLAEDVIHDSLTDREIEVLQLVAQGLSNKSVARELDIAVATVKAHVKSIFAKLGAGSRTQASMLARRRGLIPIEPRDEAPVVAGRSVRGSGSDIGALPHARLAA